MAHREPHPGYAHRPGVWSGLSFLPATLAINGISVTPSWRYRGQDASVNGWNAWGYGSNLTYNAGTAPEFGGVTPLLDLSDEAVLTKGGAWYTGATPIISPRTKDFVLEFFGYVTSYACQLFSSYVAPDSNYVEFYSTNTIRNVTFQLDVAGAGGSKGIASVAVVQGWTHAMLFYDASGSAQWYVNAIAAGTPTAVSTVGDVNIARAPGFLARPDGSTPSTGDRVVYMAWWEYDNWLDTHLQSQVAIKRCVQLFGGYPFWGQPTSMPTAYGTPTGSCLQPRIEPSDNTSKTYHLIARGAPRYERVVDADDRPFVGLINEPSRQNRWLRSADMTQSAWVKRGACTAAYTTAVQDPTGGYNAILISNLADPGVDDFYQAVSSGLTANLVCGVGLWFRRLSTSGYVRIHNAAASTRGRWWLDLSTLPDAWIHLTRSSPYLMQRDSDFQTSAGGALYTSFDNGYQGTTTNFYLWSMQVELSGLLEPSLDIVTAGAALTRTDSHIVPWDANLCGLPYGAVRFSFYAPTTTDKTLRHTLWSVNDGSTSNCIEIYIHTDGTLCLQSRQALGVSGDITIAGDVCDGKIHEVLANWHGDTGVLELCCDGIWANATGADIISTATQISFGQDGAGATNAYAAIPGDFKCFTHPIRSFVTRGSGFRA